MPKKAFVVYPRTKEIAAEGLKTKGGRKKFRGGSFLNVSENGAAEIRDTYRKEDVHVVEDPQLARALNGEKWDVKGDKVKTLHNYFFSNAGFGEGKWGKMRSDPRYEETRPGVFKLKNIPAGYEWEYDGSGWELVKIPTLEEVKQKREARRRARTVQEMT